jgi:pSer/pThr/pTyr-binding forkhead associated (FHA) protein
MPSLEEIEELKRRLQVLRRTLAHYLYQKAQLSTAFMPPSVVHGILETRTDIKRVKSILKDWGFEVERHPDDEEDSNIDLISEKDKFIEAYIECIQGIEIGNKYILKETTYIGKQRTTIILEDPVISANHCFIIRIGNNFFLNDEGSTNGTYLNDKKMTGYNTVPINDGDIISLAPPGTTMAVKFIFQKISKQ